MELRQISESILRVSEKAKIQKRSKASDDDEIFTEAIENRPLIQREKMLKPNKTNTGFKSVDNQYIYKLEFDESTNLSDAWVDS